MQAIQTSFVGQTEKKPAKIVAKCGISKLSVQFDSKLDMVQNHAKAAEKIALELGMVHQFVGAQFAGDWYWNPRNAAEIFNVADALAEPVEPALDDSKPIQATHVAADPESVPVEPVKAPGKARRAA